MDEHTFSLLAIDAGVSSGYIAAQLPGPGEGTWGDEDIITFGQFKANEPRDTARRLLNVTFDIQPDVVIVEQFDLRPSNKFLADLTPVKVNAILDYVLGGQIVWQTPAQAKNVIRDAQLKNLGFWPTGKTVGEPDADDVRDAARHMYFYLVKDKRNADIAARMT